jgi:hypothetical protein
MEASPNEVLAHAIVASGAAEIKLAARRLQQFIAQPCRFHSRALSLC